MSIDGQRALEALKDALPVLPRHETLCGDAAIVQRCADMVAGSINVALALLKQVPPDGVIRGGCWYPDESKRSPMGAGWIARHKNMRSILHLSTADGWEVSEVITPPDSRDEQIDRLRRALEHIKAMKLPIDGLPDVWKPGVAAAWNMARLP